MLKHLDLCAIEDEYILNAKDIIYLHDINFSIERNIPNAPGFIFRIYEDDIVRSFYTYKNRNDIEIAYYPSRSRVAGCVRPENVGITISHIILKNEGNCEYCTSNIHDGEKFYGQ